MARVRCHPSSAYHCCGVLDVALGPNRAHSFDAAHGLLVVMGRHVPRLSFLSVLLSDEEALTPAEDFYHRLLTIDEQDELEFVEAYLKANSLTALYDSVFVPVIIATEMDYRLERLDDEQRLLIEQSLRDIVEPWHSSAGHIEDRSEQSRG